MPNTKKSLARFNHAIEAMLDSGRIAPDDAIDDLDVASTLATANVSDAERVFRKTSASVRARKTPRPDERETLVGLLGRIRDTRMSKCGAYAAYVLDEYRTRKDAQFPALIGLACDLARKAEGAKDGQERGLASRQCADLLFLLEAAGDIPKEKADLVTRHLPGRKDG